jgi:hypothetical protein
MAISRLRCAIPFILALTVLPAAPAHAYQEPSDAEHREAEPTRNVRLRPTPSTDKKPLMVLRPGDELQLLEKEPTNGFYHVQTEDGTEGWVSARYINVKPLSGEILALAATAPNPEDSISETWDKPAPNKTTFTGPDGQCPWNGNKSDPDTFVRKNRSDVPGSNQIHDVKWSAIHDLQFPTDKPLRVNWSPAHLQEIAKYEGVAVRTVGYLVAIKPQNGHGEGTNCGFSLASETDTHLALVGDVGDAEKNSVVIEFTPRFLKLHPRWTKALLSKYVDTNVPVRITGWLMLDPDHRNHLGRFRYTLWEIHPITKIEVFEGNSWKDTDALTPPH